MKYRWAVENHLIPAIGCVRLVDLTAEGVELCLNQMHNAKAPDEPATIRTRHKVLTVLRGALREAVRRDKLTRNVAVNARTKTPLAAEVVPLTTAEVTAVFKTCENRTNGLRWILALMLGVRQSEALGWWWSDFDLDEGTARVQRQLRRQHWRHGCRTDRISCGPGVDGKECPKRWRTPRFVDTMKTPAGRRILYLDEVLVGLLKAHKRRRAEERLRAGKWLSEWNEHPWVFTGPEGHPIDHSVDRRDCKKVVDQAGISKTRIHDLRHTNATMLLMNNADTRTVMSMLGRSRTAIAARYQHPVAEMQKNAATKVADFMLGRHTGAK